MQPPVWMPAARVPGVEPLARFGRKHRKRRRGGGRAGGQGQVPRGAQKPAGSHFARPPVGVQCPGLRGQAGWPSPVRAVTCRRPPPGRAPLLSRVRTQSPAAAPPAPASPEQQAGPPPPQPGLPGALRPPLGGARGRVLVPVGVQRPGAGGGARGGGLPHWPLGRRASSLGHFGRD